MAPPVLTSPTAHDIAPEQSVGAVIAPARRTRRSLRDGGSSRPVAEHDDPLHAALATVGDRWSLAVVAELVAGPCRFNDLALGLKPIARTVLSDRLRRLEEASIITKRQYSDAPVRWNYRLTLAGAELARVCGVLADWGSRHLGDGSPALMHAMCGSAITPVYSCEQCGVIPARELQLAAAAAAVDDR
ncbi:MAG: helix-turn-helix transcriptional regulator [Thermoleophilia bacterium]|nr:helix-turn-helix transcriptional regulator [Thermoleophilia bacterium]